MHSADLDHMFGSSSAKFDDPFMLPSSQHMPEDLASSLDFCLFLYYLNPQYRRASSRVIRHFITDFEYPGDGAGNEKDKLDDYLTYQLRLPQAMAEMGDEWACYGNAFYRIHFPFDRYLIDKRHNAEYSLTMFGSDLKFDLKKLHYDVPDPKNPKKRVKLPFRDRMSLDRDKIKLRKINPRSIVIRHNMISGTNEYIYRFEKELLSDVKSSKLHIVNEIPMDMLDAMRDEKDFLFYEDEIFHFKSPTISGISNQGWGLPETIANYRSLHQLQVYRKIDECVGLDYMVPFRLFHPEVKDTESSVVKNLILSQWRTQIETIIKNRRKDKFAIHALPFPVKYEEFGAQGKELAPKDLVEYQTNAMLDGMGYPAELFKGSLTIQQVPTSVRLFENSFMFIHLGFTQFAQWISSKISRYLGEEFISVSLSKPSLADNIDRQNIIMQLSSAGEISRKKAYSFLGIDDPVEEKRDRLEEDMEIQKIQQLKGEELQREMEAGSIDQQLDAQAQAQQEGQAGGSPPGGMPQGGGGGTSPLDVQDQARQTAEQLLAMPEGPRRKELMALKASNPNMHAAVKQFMEEMRSQAGSEGVQNMYQSMQGG
jgi:hypothetical protein